MAREDDAQRARETSSERSGTDPVEPQPGRGSTELLNEDDSLVGTRSVHPTAVVRRRPKVDIVGETGYIPGKREWASESRNSTSSDEPSNVSIVRYKAPRNVREFAAQANLIATAVLNGKIDLETARTYSSIARTVAQAITAETTRARFLKAAPDLTFPDLEDGTE